jgi:hypothetical protein
MMQIPSDLDPALIPLAFLIGSWSGSGVGAGDLPFTQRLEIAVVPGHPVLSHVSTATAADGSVAAEVGFWRVGEGLTDVELLVVDGAGFAEVSYGTVSGYRVELGSDAVLRSATGVAVSAIRRLYGRLEADLAYAVDRAVGGGRLAAHASARLHPITDPDVNPA